MDPGQRAEEVEGQHALRRPFVRGGRVGDPAATVRVRVWRRRRWLMLITSRPRPLPGHERDRRGGGDRRGGERRGWRDDRDQREREREGAVGGGRVA